MAERFPDERPERYDDTNDPRNPPNSVANPAVRRNALWLYLGPIVIIAVCIAIAFFYWTNRNRTPDDTVVPTTGVQESRPGGGSPDPRPGNPAEEQEYRGGEGR
jgi:hypothetical protein